VVLSGVEQQRVLKNLKLLLKKSFECELKTLFLQRFEPRMFDWVNKNKAIPNVFSQKRHALA